MSIAQTAPYQDINIVYACPRCDRTISRTERRRRTPKCFDCGFFMVEQTPDVIAAEKDLRRFLHEDHGREYREKILKRFISTFRVQANRQYERLIRIAEHGIRHPPRDDFSNTEIEPADITV